MRTTPNRMLGIAVGIIALVAIVLGALSASWNVQQRNLTTPEGVVQAYLSAVFDHRSDAAAALLVSDSSCTADDIDMTYMQEGARVDLLSSKVDGDSALVVVRSEFSNGDPFGGTYGENHTYRLLKSQGEWRIAGIPWPLGGCGRLVK